MSALLWREKNLPMKRMASFVSGSSELVSAIFHGVEQELVGRLSGRVASQSKHLRILERGRSELIRNVVAAHSDIVS
jgi:hypothetical protein